MVGIWYLVFVYVIFNLCIFDWYIWILKDVREERKEGEGIGRKEEEWLIGDLWFSYRVERKKSDKKVISVSGGGLGESRNET